MPGIGVVDATLRSSVLITPVALLALVVDLPAVAAPLTVHAVVLPDPRDGADGVEIAHGVERLLRGSGAYDCVDWDLLAGRLGEDRDALYERCSGDVACWRAAGQAAGVEQIVLVDRVDPRTMGIRVVDVGASGPFRLDKADVHPGGTPDDSLVDRLFFAPGSLRIVDAPSVAKLVLDGGYSVPVPGRLDLPSLSSGKHTLELSSDGYTPLFVTVLVYPGQQTVVSAPMTRIETSPSRLGRWTTFFGVAVVVAAGAALGLEASDGGFAVRSR